MLRKKFPKPPSPPALVYLFSLMIVLLILAWLHSSAGVDCTVLSLQMTSNWTVSIWRDFIYRGSGKAIFRWVNHFPSPFLSWRIKQFYWVSVHLHAAIKPVLGLWGHISREIRHTYLDAERHTAQIYFWVIGSLTIAPPCVCSASHLSCKGQGMQISHPAHDWQECPIVQPSA